MAKWIDKKVNLKRFSMENTSYFFIPFKLAGTDRFRPFVSAAKESSSWIQVHDKVKYMHRFVADKLDANNEDTCQCFHFRLNDDARSEYGLPDDETWCATRPDENAGLTERYRFRLRDIHLYSFSTGVGIFAFRFNLEQDDPFWISNVQYYMKKVSRIALELGDENRTATMQDIAGDLLGRFEIAEGAEFFFFAYPGTERANALTFIHSEPKEDFSKELYFLRRCYGNGYIYVKNEEQEKEELLTASEDVHWGISPEAAAMIACPDIDNRKQFIETTLFRNFNSQYMLMYVLLLHQKYTLYMFLMEISKTGRSDLRKLESYRNRLYEFEADFVFSCITEVPQYQLLYDKMTQAFALRKMYEDVHEPIISLGEVRRQSDEREQRKRDKAVDKALSLIAMLSLFSACVDSYDFLREFLREDMGANAAAVRVIQIIVLIIIFFVVIRAYIVMRRNRRSDE